LKNNGHVVGFLGDGINDAPSMKTADVGISVDNAVDVAKDQLQYPSQIQESKPGISKPLRS